MATLSNKEARNQAAQGGTNSVTTASPTEKATTSEVNNLVEFKAPRYYTVREDTKATIRVLDAKGKDIVKPLQNFILGSLNFSLVERADISETYDGVDIVFLGEKPTMVQLSGSFINALNPNWRDEFMVYYGRNLRGSKVAKKKATILLTVDGLLVEGAILNTNVGQQAVNDGVVSFSMQMIAPDGVYSALASLVDSTVNTTEIPKNLTKIQQALVKEITYGTGKSVIMANE